MKKVIDAGTTWSKIISTEKIESFSNFYSEKKDDLFFYVVPSVFARNSGLKFDFACGHMTNNLVEDEKTQTINEAVALCFGLEKLIKQEKNLTVVDLGSRDAKRVDFKSGKFFDLDWNTSCASSTGATVEMLLKFYNLNSKDIKFEKEKYSGNCGIFALEKIMDDIANGLEAKYAIAKLIHGIAFNTWNFAKKPDILYLSGGFCNFEAFVKSLEQYSKVKTLGRFILSQGLLTLNVC